MRRLIAVTIFALVAGACSGGDGGGTVRLLTHDFFAVSDDVLEQFTRETGLEVEILRGGDAGLVVNQAVLTAGNPVGDVLFGVDTTLLSRAVASDLFTSYRSPGMWRVDPAFDAGSAVTPIDFGDVCLNYDVAAFAGAAPPSDLLDLIDPDFESKLVVPDPSISSPGLAFLLATVAEFGEEGPYTWLDYWRDLTGNGLEVASDWGAAYYGSFSGTGGGDRPIVLSYASSPPAEAMATDGPPPTASMEAGCFRQVEYAGVLRGADNPAGARLLIDFMLGDAFQEDVPLNMFVFPVNRDASLPSVFVENATIPSAPLTIEPGRIEANRERWIAEWTAVVLG